MESTPESFNESVRLAAVESYGLLDTQAEAIYDRITQLAADICETPIALVSLIDRERQWFKSACGLPQGTETGREVAFCAHAIMQNTLYEVSDARQDPRFHDNPLVTGEPHIRFYAGMPLINAGGQALGTLCVIDRVPHTLTTAQRISLNHLADVVVSLFEGRKTQSQSVHLGMAMERSFSEICTFDAKTLRFVHANEAARRNLQYDLDELQALTPTDVNPSFTPQWFAELTAPLLSAEQEQVVFEARHRRRDGSSYPVEIRLQLSKAHSSSVFIAIANDIGDKLRSEAALRESEEQFRDLVEGSVQGIVVDLDGVPLFANQTYAALFGYDNANEIMELRSLDSLYVPEELLRIRDFRYSRLADKGAPSRYEFQGIRKDGTLIWLETRIRVIRWRGERAVQSTLVDITARKQAEFALLLEKERLEITQQSIGEGVITIDANGCVELMNPIAETLTGWLASKARGLPLGEVFRIVFENTNKPEPNPVARCIEEGRIIGSTSQSELISHRGDRYKINASAAPIHAPDGTVTGAVLVFQDITETHQLAERVEYQANHDSLTGLLNRSELERRIESSRKTARQAHRHHALLHIDLDNFKIVNDTAGHMAGDALLKQIAHVLEAKVRSRGSVARLGSDEFSVLLEACPSAVAQSVAKDVIATLNTLRFSWEGQVYGVGASIGLTEVSITSESTAQILTQANVACHAAKEQGRNQLVVYQEPAGESARHHRELLRAATLRNALEKDHFRLFGQAIVPLKDAANGQLHYEVLLRMEDADGSLLTPDAFVPAAERFQMMGAVDRWVIENAFRHHSKLFGIHSPIGLTINLSGNSLADQDLLSFIREHLAASSLLPERVCFEITETAAISNLADAVRFTRDLKDIGCEVALDDFGSGLSSFAYLKQFPIDYLKIDGSFVRGMIGDPIDQVMVESIHNIGRRMGIKTIAEWVENDSIVDVLNDIGVHYAQGFAVGKPLPLKELAASQAFLAQRASHLKIVKPGS